MTISWETPQWCLERLEHRSLGAKKALEAVPRLGIFWDAKSQGIPKFWVSESFCVLHRNMQSTEGWKGKNGFLCKRPNLWFLNCKQPCRILKHMAICKWFWPTQQFARTNYALWQTTSESQSFCHLLVREKRSASYYKGVSMGHTPKWPLKRSKFRHLLSGWFWWLNTGF